MSINKTNNGVKAMSAYFCNRMFARMFCMSAFSGIALAVSSIIDAICVGRVIGETGLAAVGIISPIYILYNVVGYGFSVGGSVAFAQLMGKGDEKEAVDHFNEMMILLMIFSIVFVALGNLLLNPILSLLGAGNTDGELFGLCRDYASILITAFPVFMMNFMFNDFLRCDNNQNLATAAFVIGSALDFTLNLVLVLVFGFGIKGAAYATVIAQLVEMLIALPHFFLKNKALRFRLVKLDWRRCLKSLKTGISTSVESLFIFIFILTANRLLLSSRSIDGEMYVAVLDVVMNISYITNSIFISAGETLRPLAGTFYAEHNHSQSRYILKLSLLWGYLLNSIIISVIFIFSKQFSMLFGVTESETLAISEAAVRIFCVGAFVSGTAVIFSSYYQSINEENRSARITMLRTFLILLPVTIILCIFKPEWFWYAMPTAEILTFLIVIAEAVKTRKNITDDCKYFSYMLCEIDKLGEALEQTEQFCMQQNMDARQTNMVLMFIEETCDAIIRNAFCGDKNEYIQLTIVTEENSFVLHVRDSAVKFNPFDMKTKKVTKSEDAYINSVGILMMKNKAKEFLYRSYQGFNMLTIKF